ncbi:glycosyltransferase family 39 protein [Patescibacteria group bacterium]|nr:glycosyltransferase family 39 protein [Patescibacteria group bacterium]
MLNFLFYHTPVFYLIQSIWRDEAFSYYMAKPDIFHVIANTANDFNPPLYYLLLHFWIFIAGKSDEFLRILSFIPFILTVYFAYLFARRAFSKKFAFFVATFTLLNPMLLVYSFEIRMYSLYAFFAMVSAYCLLRKNWKWYAVASVLGLYSHSFFAMIPVSYVFYYFLIKRLNKKTLWYLLNPFLFFLPWLPVLTVQFLHSGNSWIFPVDLQLINSVLGNLLTSYEGTPGHLWAYTAILSGIMLIFFLVGLIRDKKKSLLALTPIFFTLIPVLGFSIIKRPIYVNRYMIFITVFEILGISYGVWNIKNKMLKNASMAFWLILVLGVNLYLPPYHSKTDFKTAFREINKIASTNDYVYSKTPIGFLESAYYFKNDGKVFVYNPNHISIPYYIGVNVVFPNASKTTFPPYPARTFLVNDDASYEMVINR